MKKIKKFNESVLDPFGEESWDNEEKNIPIDYLSIYISYYSIIISENQISKEYDNYILLNSIEEKDIPYNKKDLSKKENYIVDKESSEWIIKINNRDDIKKHKKFINKCISDNLNKYFKKSDYKFEINLYDSIDVRIQLNEFDQYIDKYFFKK